MHYRTEGLCTNADKYFFFKQRIHWPKRAFEITLKKTYLKVLFYWIHIPVINGLCEVFLRLIIYVRVISQGKDHKDHDPFMRVSNESQTAFRAKFIENHKKLRMVKPTSVTRSNPEPFVYQSLRAKTLSCLWALMV